MKAELKAEIATTRNGRDITRGFVDALPLLPPTDSMLNRAGGYAGYDELLRDEQVAACFGQRRLAVVRRAWQVEPGGDKRLDKQAAVLVEETLARIGWDQVCDQMLYARFFGFSVAEIMWAVTGGRVEISEIRVRDRRRFGFAPDRSLRLLTSHKPDGEMLPDRKFWVLSMGASHYDEPYGRGLAHQIYWPVWFKRQGARFWAIFMEKFGAPTVVGKFPAGTSEGDANKLMQAIEAVHTDSGVRIPDGMSLELLEATRGGQGTYSEWMAYWDGAIAKALLGQTMTTEDGSSLSQAKVHMEVRQDIVTADADMLHASAADSWVRWLVDYNLPGAAFPRIWRDMEDAEDLNSRAERDEKLDRMGWRLKPEAVSEVYGDDYARAAAEDRTPPDQTKPDPAKPEPIAVSAAEREVGVAFMPPDLAALEDLLDSIDAGGTLQAEVVQMLKPLIEAAGEENFPARLAEMYPELDDAAMQDAIERLMFAAQAWGALHADRR